jgi:catechol 2,3-dioxygenase-like lactoylglutathione lyase family enzyme
VRLHAAYPVIVTDKMLQCRDFYVNHLGFRVIFQASWFVMLSSADGQGHDIAFMTPDHPSRPPGPECFSGKGVFLTLQVEDAATAYRDIKQRDIEIAHALTDEPWGQRRFALIDPAGTWVDIVQQTAPAEGFWDKYMR